MSSVPGFDHVAFESKLRAFQQLASCQKEYKTRSFEQALMGKKWTWRLKGSMSQSIREMYRYLELNYQHIELKNLAELNGYVVIIKSKSPEFVKGVLGLSLLAKRQVEAFDTQILILQIKLQLEIVHRKFLEIERKLKVVPDFKLDIELTKSKIHQFCSKKHSVSAVKQKFDELEKDINRLEQVLKNACRNDIDKLKNIKASKKALISKESLLSELNAINQNDPLHLDYFAFYNKVKGLLILDQCIGLIDDFCNQKSRRFVPAGLLSVQKQSSLKLLICYLLVNNKPQDLYYEALCLRAIIEHQLLTLIVTKTEVGAEKILKLIVKNLRNHDPKIKINHRLSIKCSCDIHNLMMYYLKLKEEQLFYQESQGLHYTLDDIVDKGIEEAKFLFQVMLKAFSKPIQNEYKRRMLRFTLGLQDRYEVFQSQKIEEFTWKTVADIKSREVPFGT